MKIAICDDDTGDIEHLRKHIDSHSDEHEIYCFLSTEDFLKRIYLGEQFDFLFLDIQMPGVDGWEIAQDLKKLKQKIFIAMVTVHGEYIYDCFDRVDWFAVKPVSEEKVWHVINIAKERIYPMVFEFTINGVSIALTAPEIIYIEVHRNTLTINSTRKNYEIRMPLKKAKALLVDCHRFVQTHKSFIVNLDHYDSVDGACIILKNQVRISLSRTFRESFFKSLIEYIRGERQ